MPQKLVTIATYFHPLEAHVAKTKLESEGVDCFLYNEHTISMDIFYSQALGGVQLQVLEEDVERAKELLGAREKQSVVALTDPTCPQCSSRSVYYERRPWKATIVFFYLGLPLPFFKWRWKCADCGHEWKGKG